jgi:NADPH-dependent 2,4-dienoyl-CoA reductase/sulfur reductase-like enzyme
VQPSRHHYYQPLWTLVGGGFKDIEESRRPMGDVLPAGADWVPAHVTEFRPSDNRVTTSDGRSYEYDYLVVATGMQPKWAKVRGLPEALGDGAVVSNMSFRTAPLTHKAVSALRSGRALFTMPKGVVKCPGAGHKVCYISEDHFRRAGRRPDVAVTLALAGDRIFGVPRYAETIQGLVKNRGIDVKLNTNLVEVRGPQKEAVFEIMGRYGQAVGEEVLRYDLLHVTPPQGPLDVVAHSQLANEDGWVAVNPEVGHGEGVGSGAGFGGQVWGSKLVWVGDGRGRWTAPARLGVPHLHSFPGKARGARARSFAPATPTHQTPLPAKRPSPLAPPRRPCSTRATPTCLASATPPRCRPARPPPQRPRSSWCCGTTWTPSWPGARRTGRGTTGTAPARW